MHNILALTDRAVVAYLIAKGCGDATTIFPFKKSTAKALPCIIVHSSTATPDAPFSATCDVLCTVVVRTIASVDEPESEDEPIDANDALIDLVSSALHMFGNGATSGGDMADEITSAALGAGSPPFTCQGVSLEKIEASVDYQHSMDSWSDEFTLRLAVCPANVG